MRKKPIRKSPGWRARALRPVLQARISGEYQADTAYRTLARLEALLERGIAEFIYDKTSGEQRTAIGTLDPETIRAYGGGPPPDPLRYGEPKTFDYFDLVRRNWRSFRPENLVRIL